MNLKDYDLSDYLFPVIYDNFKVNTLSILLPFINFVFVSSEDLKTLTLRNKQKARAQVPRRISKAKILKNKFEKSKNFPKSELI